MKEKRNFAFSWSGLGDYDMCPHKYFLGRIAKIEVDAAPQLLDGVKFHDFAERYNKSLIQNKDNINEEFIKSFLDETTTIEEKNFILYELERYKNLVAENNEKYYIPIGAEDWLEEDFDGYPFRGKQDYLGLTPDGNYYIMDYKTRYPNYPRDAIKKLEHQLILYACLIEEKEGIDIKHIAGYFYKEKNESKNKTFFKKYHGATKTALKKYVNRTIHNLLNDEKFERKIQNLCNYCSFKDICFNFDREMMEKNDNILKDYIENKQDYYPGYDLEM